MTSYQCHGNEPRESHPPLSILSYSAFLHLMSSTSSEISEFNASPLNYQEIKSSFSCLGWWFDVEMGIIAWWIMWERDPPYVQTFNQSPFQPHASPLVSAVSDQESENLRESFWIKWILLSKALSNMAASSESVAASQFAVCLPKYVEVPCLMISYLPFSISLWIHTYI